MRVCTTADGAFASILLQPDDISNLTGTDLIRRKVTDDTHASMLQTIRRPAARIALLSCERRVAQSPASRRERVRKALMVPIIRRLRL